MIIVYDSLTGMGKKVADKLGYPSCDINLYTSTAEPVFLITRSFNFGEITQEAEEFLEKHASKVVGVAVGGNRNWGENFGAAGDKINHKYNIPLGRKYEGLGFSADIEYMKNWLQNYMQGEKND